MSGAKKSREKDASCLHVSSVLSVFFDRAKPDMRKTEGFSNSTADKIKENIVNKSFLSKSNRIA